MNLARVIRLLTAQSLVLVLASVNRLWSATDAELLPHGSLRLVDLLNLLVLAPASLVVFHALLEELLTGAGEAARRRARLGFVAAAYLFAASYGMHEAADYLHARFCDPVRGDLCEIVAYQDDELSHFLFFAGFAGIAAVLLAADAAGADVRPGGRDRAAVLANSALVAAAIVANLGFEEIGLDLLVIVLVAALAMWLWRRAGPRPLIVYFATAYATGLVVTLAVRAF